MATLDEAILKVGIDPGDAVDGAKQVAQATEQLEQSADQAAEAIIGVEQAAEQMGEAADAAAATTVTAVQEIEQAYEQASVAAEATSSSVVEVQRAYRDQASASVRVTQATGEATDATKEATRASADLSRTTVKTAEKTEETSKAMETMQSRASGLVTALKQMVAAFSAVLVVQTAVSEVIEYEQALVRVSRVTQFTADETARFTSIIDEAVTSMPLMESNIMAIAQAAAELGIKGADNIANFSVAMEKLASIAGVNGKTAAVSILQLFQATGESTDNAAAFASTIVRLGNETRATADEILSMSNRIGARGGLFKVSAADAAALAAAMASTGAEGRQAVGSIVEILDTMRGAIDEGGDKLTNLGVIMGTTGDEAAKIFGNNSIDAMLQFVRGLRDAEASGIPFSKSLKAVGAEGDALLQSLPVVAKNLTLISGAVATARNEMQSASTLNSQMSQTSETLGSRLQILRNTVAEAFEETKMFSEGLKTLIDFASGTIRAFFGMESAVAPVTEEMRTAAAVIKGLLAGLAGFVIVSNVGTALVALTKGLMAARGAVVALTAAIAANPIGAIAVAVSVGIAALVALYQKYKDVSVSIGDETYNVSDIVLGVWDHIVEKVRFAFDTISRIVQTGWTVVTTVTRVTWTYLSGLLDGAFTFFKTNFSRVLDGALSALRTWTNRVIGMAMTVKDSFGLMIDNLKAVTNALSKFDPSKPLSSAKDVALALADAMDPVKAFGRFNDKLQKNLETDWVQIGINSGNAFVDNLIAAIDANPDLKQWLVDFNRLFGTGMLGDIEDKINARRTARMAADMGPPKELAGGVYGQAATDIDNANTALREFNLLLGENDDAAEKARQSLSEMLAALNSERELIAQFGTDQEALNNAREQAELRVKAQALAEKAYANDVVEQVMVVNQLVSALGQLQRARIAADAAAKMKTMDDQVTEEFRLLGMTTEERERAIAVTQYHAEAMRLYAGDVAQADAATEAYRQRLVELNDARQLVDMFKDMGQAMADAFVDAAFEAKDLNDVLKNLIKTLTQQALSRLVMQPLMGQFGSFLNTSFGIGAAAKGAVFDAGRVTAFARGGVVGGPTFFPMGGGGMGLMGEAGPEGILPLERDSTGNLGVRSNGGGVTMIVNTPDANSFRQSRGQIANDLRRAMRG